MPGISWLTDGHEIQGAYLQSSFRASARNHWYWIGLGILSTHAIWFTAWTVVITLTYFGLAPGSIDLGGHVQVELREFIATLPAAYLVSFYLLNLAILATVILTLRMSRHAPVLYGLCLVWDTINWVIFAFLGRFDSNIELIFIGSGIIGAWCLFQWRQNLGSSFRKTG